MSNLVSVTHPTAELARRKKSLTQSFTRRVVKFPEIFHKYLQKPGSYKVYNVHLNSLVFPAAVLKPRYFPLHNA